MTIPESFLGLFAVRLPTLVVKFSRDDEKSIPVKVEHRLGSRPTVKGNKFLQTLGKNPALRDFVEFYEQHNGLELCRSFNSLHKGVRPLIEFKPAETISSFTDRYRPGGNDAWVIDLNKSKNLYRGSDSWIAFGDIDSGSGCLTLFWDGEHAGAVFYLTAEPRFNILRPIAKSFSGLLEKIAKDLPKFLCLVRATVTLRGDDGDNYGCRPVGYLTTGRA